MNAQVQLDVVKLHNLDTIGVFGEIRKNIAENDFFSDRDDYFIFPIYLFLDSINHDAEEYLNYSFLKSMYPSYSHPSYINPRFEKNHRTLYGRRRNSQRGIPLYVEDTSKYVLDLFEYWVYDSTGTPRCDNYYRRFKTHANNAIKDGDGVVERHPIPTDLLFERKLDFLISICRKPNPKDADVLSTQFFYGINISENKIYVVFRDYQGVKVVPLEEIISSHWIDFQNGLSEYIKQSRLEMKMKVEK